MGDTTWTSCQKETRQAVSSAPTVVAACWGTLQEVLFDFTGHPAAEDERFLHPSGSEELQRVVDHGNVAQRQQSLSAVTDG